MDGFHLTVEQLREAGILDRKGEPDTFDAAGYTRLLRTVRDAAVGETVAWPAYDREIHDPVPGGVIVDRQRIIITEGNYLLLDEDGWSGVFPLLDEAWYLDVPRPVIEQRLLRRHIRGGRTPDAARNKIARSDMRNAALVEGTRMRADVVLRKAGRGYRID